MRKKCLFLGLADGELVKRPVKVKVIHLTGCADSSGVRYPVFGMLLSPIIAAAAMSFSSVSVIGNALRLGQAEV